MSHYTRITVSLLKTLSFEDSRLTVTQDIDLNNMGGPEGWSPTFPGVAQQKNG